jgi:hypothetical protein
MMPIFVGITLLTIAAVISPWLALGLTLWIVWKNRRNFK